jgi:hypothetical protein
VQRRNINSADKKLKSANFKSQALFPSFRALSCATKNFKALVLKEMNFKTTMRYFFIYTSSDIVTIPKELRKTSIFAVNKKVTK